MRTVVDVLATARTNIINPFFWWNGGLARCDQRCAAQSIYYQNEIHIPSIVDDALDALATAIDPQFVRGGRAGSNLGTIVEFNDSHTHSEVLAAFDRAIAVETLKARAQSLPSVTSGADQGALRSPEPSLPVACG